MDFSEALQHLKAGKPVRRAVWENAGISLVLLPGITVTAAGPPLEAGAEYRLQSVFALVSNKVGSPWAMPAFDVLAEDWQLVEVKEDVFA